MRPSPVVWDFLRPWVETCIAFLAALYAGLSIRNINFPDDRSAGRQESRSRVGVRAGVLEGFGIDPQRPIVTQISPLSQGPVASFAPIAWPESTNCQLVPAGQRQRRSEE
jgi:hypothetical protein